ncbi:hypothetical protein IG631_06821 [Alternaria alternata]|nr:hypothetical protein IG631_06821 [Alternaria alternata]
MEARKDAGSARRVRRCAIDFRGSAEGFTVTATTILVPTSTSSQALHMRASRPTEQGSRNSTIKPLLP